MKGVTADLVRAKTDLDFGDALNALKGGMRVARTGWNGKGMWLVLVKPATNVGSLGREGPGFSWILGINGQSFDRGLALRLLPFIAMKTADNAFVPWLASQTDILAEDWTVAP